VGDNTITTGSGDDVIRTGSGNDDIDAGEGKNFIEDLGGTNWIVSGNQADDIYHSNIDDVIFAFGGINNIWLNGIHQGWQNPKIPLDVDRDMRISPLDALRVIDYINQTGTRRLEGSADSSSMFYDTDNDGYLTPLDVLKVIEWMNRSGGEGEAVSEMSSPMVASGAQSSSWSGTGILADIAIDHQKMLDVDNYFATLTDGELIEEQGSNRSGNGKRRRLR
jgi:hypothetical protein